MTNSTFAALGLQRTEMSHAQTKAFALSLFKVDIEGKVSSDSMKSQFLVDLAACST